MADSVRGHHHLSSHTLSDWLRAGPFPSTPLLCPNQMLIMEREHTYTIKQFPVAAALNHDPSSEEKGTQLGLLEPCEDFYT